ncbi:unnamed protein product [Symbiodinium natans]|uniref:Uncharacterized protein n=1 Tax=Symbiodinium natans TaxID=878477 RepID=A0A812QFY4_9DINO|nr:unnamed protein product [Symbiodinium natans]
MRSHSLDWPLSQTEKRGRLLELYDKEVRANDQLESEQAARCALDWDGVRSAAVGRGRPSGGGSGAAPANLHTQAPTYPECGAPPWEWQCVLAKAAEAAASLGALLSDRLGSLTNAPAEGQVLRLRARSESSKLLRPALRGPDACPRAKRVHFADAAEPEPEVPAPSEPSLNAEDLGRSRSPGRRDRRSRLRERLHGFSEGV